MRRLSLYLALISLSLFVLAISAGRGWRLDAPGIDLNTQLRTMLAAQDVRHIPPAPALPEPLVALGESLFFDNVLSGNQDVSCATCHHPAQGTADALPISIGTQTHGERPLRDYVITITSVNRNAPDVYNLHMKDAMFWDGRVTQMSDGSFITPAGHNTPHGLINSGAAQALFPISARAEMRGHMDDVDVHGEFNALAWHADEHFTQIWDGIMAQVLAHPAYVEMFAAAYPYTDTDLLTIYHAVNAIGAYEVQTFSFTGSPFNRYLLGDDNALSDEAKEGAILFFGESGCSACHSGALLSDQGFHNIAVPQFGPGKGRSAPLDTGRWLETRSAAHRFAFRTPSLHNVTLSAPYMHNGAYATLEDVLRHKSDPAASLRGYDGAHLPDNLRETLQTRQAVHDSILATLDPLAATPRPLEDEDIAQLIAFLASLTDPAAASFDNVPESVPSGLPVFVPDMG
jgi:cytochrome c peroxidase